MISKYYQKLETGGRLKRIIKKETQEGNNNWTNAPLFLWRKNTAIGVTLIAVSIRRKNDALSGVPWIIYRASRAENFYPIGERKRPNTERIGCRISRSLFSSWSWDLEKKEVEMLVRSEKRRDRKSRRWRKGKRRQKPSMWRRREKKSKYNRKNHKRKKLPPFPPFSFPWKCIMHAATLKQFRFFCNVASI